MERIISPHGLKAILTEYGNPDKDGDWILDPTFYDSMTAIFDLPFPMRLSWDPLKYVKRIRAHRYVGIVMIDALREICGINGLSYLQDNNLDFLGGAFHFRKMTGALYLSTHSWGIAIDVNPHRGPFGKKTTMPDFIVQAFKKRGFEWGGDWPAMNPKWPCDGMHFQACTGY